MSTILSWKDFTSQSCGIFAPVILSGARTSARALALARLADEHVRVGGKCLWIANREAVRPLPWLALREQRLDARPMRPDLGDVPWPLVNPFDLDLDLCATWAAAVLGCADATQRAALESIIQRKLSSMVRGATRWKAPTPADIWPEVINESKCGTHVAIERLISLSGTQTTLAFASDLTVICGHVADLATRQWQILLVLFGFISAARRNNFRQPPLLVLEDWLESLPGVVLGWVADILADLAMTSQARVLVVSASPASLGTVSGGASLLAGSHKVIATCSEMAWPSSWPLMTPELRIRLNAAWGTEVGIAPVGSRDWHFRVVPIPADVEST